MDLGDYLGNNGQWPTDLLTEFKLNIE